MKNIKQFYSVGLLTLTSITLPSALAADNNALEKAYKALGADKLSSLEINGSGSWYQFGQSPAPGTAWPAFNVSSYTASINFDTASARVLQTRKQVIEANRARPVPVEQKPDQYVNGDIAWNIAVPQGAPAGTAATAQAQAAAVEERQAEIWTTPQGFLKAAQKNNAVVSQEGASTRVEFTRKKNKYVGRINKAGQVERVQTWIDNPVLGDTPIQITYSNYKDFNGINFPSQIVKTQGGAPVLDLKVASVKANVAADFPVPEAVKSNPKPAIAVTSTELAPGVFYLQGGTHHSLAIAQKDHVVVVEAPQNEERSLAVIAKVNELIPGKKITHLINSHQHFDHSGGLRTYADAGAIIVTHELNKPFYETAWKQPRSINADKLSVSKKAAKYQTFTDKLVLDDGQRKIEIHQIKDNGHNDAFALVYLPKEKILIEADAFTPPPPNAPAQTSVNPFAANLYENIKRLKLDVVHIAPLHGRLAKLEELNSFITVAQN
ncbi:MAG: MBL fold metallo-hydrolase [Cellvibrio sp.]|uniref:MBL fold metallo-hydrolase n=1 Tax=Cellvibrio sp. TaxID=1965322 RepID=UPI0031B54EFD